MTSTMPAFALASTLYFIVGSRIEERRLIAQYGDAYLHYQQTTPWLLPLPRKYTSEKVRFTHNLHVVPIIGGQLY